MQDMTTLRIEINVKNRIYLEKKKERKGERIVRIEA